MWAAKASGSGTRSAQTCRGVWLRDALGPHAAEASGSGTRSAQTCRGVWLWDAPGSCDVRHGYGWEGQSGGKAQREPNNERRLCPTYARHGYADTRDADFVEEANSKEERAFRLCHTFGGIRKAANNHNSIEIRCNCNFQRECEHEGEPKPGCSTALFFCASSIGSGGGSGGGDAFDA